MYMGVAKIERRKKKALITIIRCYMEVIILLRTKNILKAQRIHKRDKMSPIAHFIKAA